MKKRLLATIPVLLVVFLCASNVYANDNACGYDIEEYTGYSSDGYVAYQVKVSSLWLDSDAMYSNTSGNYYSYDNHVYINIILSNTTNKDIYCNNLYTYYLYLDSHMNLGTQGGTTYYSPYKITDVKPINDDNCFLINTIGTLNDSYSLAFMVSPNYIANGRLCIPAGKTVSSQFILTIDGFNATGVTVGGTDQYYVPTVNSMNLGTSKWTQTDNLMIGAPWYSLPKIYQSIQDFFNAYNQNSSKSQDVTNNSNSLTNQSDAIHNQENGYYTQTNTALSNTGLSNFQFSSNVIGGMGKVKDQFTYVWNKLGNYNVVFTFSLTLSVALMIIRHVRPIRRKQEE